MGAVVARGGNAEEGTATEERPYVEERDGSVGGGGSGVTVTEGVLAAAEGKA